MKKKIKSILSLFLAFLILFSANFTSIPAITASAETLTGTSGIFTYEITDGEVTITKCDSSASGEVTIPSTIEGYPVTVIGKEAFALCKNIESVTLPNSITSMGDAAFGECTQLESIFLSENLIEIPFGTFALCETLVTIDIPDSVETIGDGAFMYCSALKTVNFGDNIKTIGESAFAYCSALKTVNFGDNIKTIGKFAFAACESLGLINIPETVTTINDLAFALCTSLESIFISKNVESLGSNIISGCELIESFEISSENPNYMVDENGVLFNKSGTELIAYPSGRYCETYIVPDGVLTIKTHAFSRCNELATIVIPNSVTEIGDYAFGGCNILNRYVHIPSSVTSIGEGITNSSYATICSESENCFVKTYADDNGISFEVCEGHGYNGEITEGHFSYKIVNGKATVAKCDTEASGEISVPSTIEEYPVVSIADNAFMLCDKITKINLPASITTLSDYSFYYCNNINSFSVDTTSEYFSTDEAGVLFDRDKSVLLSYPCGNTATEYIIPNSVVEIGANAFQLSKNLKNVTIGNSVEIIGNGAFSWSGLTKIDIPDNVTELGASAFASCNNLKTVKFGKGLSKISSSAFLSAPITSINIPENITVIERSAFQNCGADIYIPASVTSIGSLALHGNKNISVDENNSNYSSDEYGVLFNKDKTTLIQYPTASSITKYDIPYGVNKIDDWAFFLNKLENFSIPNSVTEIGDCVFASMKMEYIHIPTSVTTIGVNIISINEYICSTTENCYAKTYADENGFTFKICSGHASSETPDAPDEPHAHSYTGKVTTEATCSESGIRTYTCSCGSSYTETIAKLIHSTSDWVITKYPTSSEEGLKVKTCILCGEIMESETLPVINDYTDSETGIIIQFPDKIETEPDINSILDSSLFDIIGKTIRILKGKAFSIILNLAEGASGKTYIVRIPLPSGYNPETTRVFAVDSTSQTSYIINSTYSDGYIIFEISGDCSFVIAEIYDESLYGFESTEISINKNKKVNLNLTAPGGYYIIYKSSDPSVVEVDSNGNVNGLSAGTAVITAYVDGTDIVYECTVTVTLTWWQILIQAILSLFIAIISIFA